MRDREREGQFIRSLTGAAGESVGNTTLASFYFERNVLMSQHILTFQEFV